MSPSRTWSRTTVVSRSTIPTSATISPSTTATATCSTSRSATDPATGRRRRRSLSTCRRGELAKPAEDTSGPGGSLHWPADRSLCQRIAMRLAGAGRPGSHAALPGSLDKRAEEALVAAREDQVFRVPLNAQHEAGALRFHRLHDVCLVPGHG